jgi:hypothetical protein
LAFESFSVGQVARDLPLVARVFAASYQINAVTCSMLAWVAQITALTSPSRISTTGFFVLVIVFSFVFGQQLLQPDGGRPNAVATEASQGDVCQSIEMFGGTFWGNRHFD